MAKQKLIGCLGLPEDHIRTGLQLSLCWDECADDLTSFVSLPAGSVGNPCNAGSILLRALLSKLRRARKQPQGQQRLCHRRQLRCTRRGAAAAQGQGQQQLCHRRQLR